MSTVAYLVSGDYQDVIRRATAFQDEFALTRPFFEELGLRVECVDWQAVGTDWSQYAAVLPKAVWNYSNEPDAFRGFITDLQSRGVRAVNSAETILWNMNKNYLLELARRGLPVIPLRIHPRGAKPVDDWFSAFSDREVIIKPAVSAGSKDTVRFFPNHWQEHRETLDRILYGTDLVIQPFIKEIQTEGEYSFFYFGAAFSHAVLKKPRPGDFRAHSYFGAEFVPYSPTATEIATGLSFVRAVPGRCAYARVDLIRVEGQLSLVELEVIEPYLYLEYGNPARAIRSFVTAVADAVQR